MRGTSRWRVVFGWQAIRVNSEEIYVGRVVSGEQAIQVNSEGRSDPPSDRSQSIDRSPSTIRYP